MVALGRLIILFVGLNESKTDRQPSARCRLRQFCSYTDENSVQKRCRSHFCVTKKPKNFDLLYTHYGV